MKAATLGAGDRPAARERLAPRARENLWLLDLVEGLGRPPPAGESGAEVAAVYEDGRLQGLLALRPCLVAEAGLPEGAVACFGPWLAPVRSGLLKSPAREADALWEALHAKGCRALVDRKETSFLLEGAERLAAEAPPGARIRRARAADLPALVHAARASLAEEGRPDPYALDPEGFRRWVRGRIGHAWVSEAEGRVVFVGYADVQRREGWLLQGIYTWPLSRRQGHARAGVAALCHAAFGAGAEHVQLAVVAGNEPAERLYRGLGFRPFAALRTLLFETPGP